MTDVPRLGPVFDSIYANDSWGGGSGPGSIPSATAGYRQLLQRFLHSHGIKSVLDIGCGDWQFSKYMDWKDISYLGVDIAATVIERNKKYYERPGIRFDFAPENFEDLQSADLAIVKDVLQHLSNNTVQNFISALPRFKFALITNCIRPYEQTNAQIEDGGFRPLDLRMDPFGLDAIEVFRFSSFNYVWRKWRPQRRCQWEKITLLWQREKA